ncbi:MAG: sigma-54 dependent transcriptional regulator [Acidobacteriota bacterium]
MTRRLLAVDDDPTIRFAIRSFFENRDFQVSEAADCAAARLAMEGDEPDVIILDYRMPDGTALDLLEGWQNAGLSTPPVILLTGHGSIDLAVRAIKQGADNFVTKPVDLETLSLMVDRALENRKNRRDSLLRQNREHQQRIDPFIGNSEAIRRLEYESRKVARGSLPILIHGETGSGKGVLARWLHQHSGRSDASFVDINCAGLSREFLESELFGHLKGAFTGADQNKIGLLEIAHRGTVFLDEIGDLALEVQPKLLKVLEEKRFRRLGDVRDRRVDLWLIAASHQDLNQLAQDGEFRLDLYFRLSTIPLTVPPLRQRREDIPSLAEVFLQQLSQQLGRSAFELSPEARTALTHYDWPGNIRELRNVLERAALLADGSILDAQDLRFQPSVEPPAAPATPAMTLEEMEIQHIEQALRATDGQVARAAERLGIPRSTLYQKLKRFGIDPASL